MDHDFDKHYWERHWRERAEGPEAMRDGPAHPYLADEVAGLVPGTALEAGCGTGAEAVWLAEAGWRVTGADLSSEALSRAGERAAARGVAERVRWVEADLSTWSPGERFDLVATHYAHPAMPQLAFYDRLGEWVAPGGTLLVVGHLHHGEHGHGHGEGHEQPPPEASVTARDVVARLDPARWTVVTADERHRTVPGHEGRTLHDVVVRATRR